MLNPSQMFRLMTEMVFMLAGALLLFAGLTGRYIFDPRQASWLVLAVILVFWGLRSLRSSRLIPVRNLRLAGQLGGVSLVLVGLIMVSLAWMPFGWIGRLVAVAGTIFVIRGLVTAAILAIA